MSVVLSAVCDRCGAEHRPDRPVRSFSPGAVRARAAFHGWAQHDEHGVTVDVCPACVEVEAQRAAERVLVRAASAASSAGAVLPVARVVEVEAAQCRWCADGEHHWCMGSGCDCWVCA